MEKIHKMFRKATLAGALTLAACNGQDQTQAYLRGCAAPRFTPKFEEVCGLDHRSKQSIYIVRAYDPFELALLNGAIMQGGTPESFAHAIPPHSLSEVIEDFRRAHPNLEIMDARGPTQTGDVIFKTQPTLD